MKFRVYTLTNIQYEIFSDSAFRVNDIDTSHYKIGAYGINLVFGVEKFVKNDQEERNGLITTAYALKCWNFIYTEDSIAQVSIKTLNDFDKTYKAGMEVTNLFARLGYTSDRNKINKTAIDSIIFEEIDDNNSFIKQSIYLNAAPETPRDVQFDIEVTLSNGKVLNAKTQKVFIE